MINEVRIFKLRIICSNSDSNLSAFAVEPHSLPPLMLLQSVFADPYHALCNEANSS